jgi:hypothetical protein
MNADDTLCARGQSKPRVSVDLIGVKIVTAGPHRTQADRIGTVYRL